MKTLKATTARILLLCLIFIEQNVAEPAARHNVAHHQDTARRHHAPSGTQAPHKLAPSSSKVYCISADSNIYEILHKASAYCRGNDFKCTFYHYSDHKYHNLGTIDVNRELFDKLLAKYENWLMTSEPIDEINGRDSNHKVRLKGSGNKLYSTYIIDDKTPEKANRNVYDNNFIQDTTKLDTHYRRHKAKLTGDQKTRYINGERVSVDPKFNKQQKYYEVFLPKDKHRGDPRTIYVDIDGDKENDKELNNDLNDKPIKVQLNEYSSNDKGKFVIHDKHNKKDVYRQHSDNRIARTEDIEETNKYQSKVPDIKLGDNDKMLSDVNDTDDENLDDDDKLHRIHLVETNKHHNDLSADNFTYKRTNTVQLNEPVFHVENPRNRNNMHIFSLPDYTGHHSDIISDYTGYKDIHLLPNLPDDEEVPSLLSNYDISLSDATEKESPITLYTNRNLQTANDNLLPGHINYYSPKVTHGTPFSSQSGSSPIVSSSSETAAIPKYSPFDIALRSSPYSLGPETLTPCDLKTLSQGTISSSPPTVSSNEEKYKINLLSSPFEATKSFADSHLFKKLTPVNPETTYFSQPSDVTMPIDATSFLNNLPKSFESVASYSPTTTMPSPLNSKLGPEICQFPQMPYTSPYSQFSPPNMNLGLLNQLQQNNNFAKPMFNQNNMFSQPSRDIFDIKINPFITRPQFSYSYAEPINPMASYPSPGSVINSSPSAYTNSILNGNRIPGTVSNSFLPLSPVNQMSPLSLRQERPNYYSPPCPRPVGTSPYNNVSPLNLENYQIADNLALNANLKVQDSFSPLQNTPLSVIDHPYRTTPSNYIRPTQANIFSSSTPNQDKPIIFNALENPLLESQDETSFYSELAHITKKPCLNLQNEPLVTFDASLLGDHSFELNPTKPTKPIVSNTYVNISDGSIGSELNKLTHLDCSLVNPDSDTIHIQLNTTINLNQEPQPKDEFNLSEDSNLILDSSSTELNVDTAPCTAVDNNKPSINVTATINIKSEQALNDGAGISEFDSSLIGTDLPIPSDDSVVTKVDTVNLTEDSSLTAFIPLEQSDKNAERELNQTVNIKQESNQTDVEYSVTDEPITILPSDLTEKELKVDIGTAGPQPLDSTLIDLESDNITESVAQELETVDGIPNVNVTVCEPDINLSVQTNIDLKPEAENPQLLEKPTGSTINITINTSVDIADNNLDVLEPELVETKPNEKSITTNKETEFVALDATHTKDKDTINEFEAGEFIPAFTSGMNIPTEDITAEILPNNKLNSSLVGPTLDELKEEPGIASTELDFTADLTGPTIFDINETLNDVPSKVVELDSSLIKPISGKTTIPPCIEPLEVSGQSDIENLQHSGAIKESDILLSSNPLTFENSLIGPSLINDTTGLETTPSEKFQEILPTSESPTINFESNLLGPSLLPHNNIKDSFENIESSLVGPGLEQVINAPEEVSKTDTKLNFSSNLIGPNLIIDANKPDLLRKLEAGTKIDDGKPGPTIVDGKPLVEESVPYSEYQLDASLIGPDLNIKAETNEVKPKFDQTNSVTLDSSLIDNLIDTEKSINGPNGPSIVSSANILSSDLKREGLPLEADISVICPNPAVKPTYEELPSLPPFAPKISFTHDLIGPGLSKLHPGTSLPNPYITQAGTPIVSNGFLEELKPTTYLKLPDLYLPATPFKNAPQHSLPCENFFTSSPLTSSLLNNGLPASVLNLPSNILSDHQSPLYANTIPFSPFSPFSKYSPLHNLPHTPFSNPYLKPEYLQSVKNPLVLNALLNNPHLKDAITYYSPIQPPEPLSQIGLPRLPNFQDLPNQYLQALNGIPFNFQPLKSTIPFAPQTKTPLSSTEINWQEVESLPVEVQNTPVKPTFKPIKNQVPIPKTYSPLQIKESDNLFDLNHQNYHMIESELDKFIQEAKHDNKLGNYETFEEASIPPCETVKYLLEDNVEKYIAEATTFVEPLNVAKEQLNLKETDFIKLEPELHIVDAIDLPTNPPPKYKPKVEEQVFYDPLKEADICKDYQLLETPVNTPMMKPSVAQKIPKLSYTDQFYPYEMLPEPLALPVKPSSSPASYAKPQISPLLSPPCLQEYTSVPASENLPTSNLRPMPTPVPSRPSKTYGSPYLPEYSSPSYIDTYNMPIESLKPGVPCKPSQPYTSPYLPTHSNAPLFETGVPIETPNLPVLALSKELPILPAPLKPLSSTPLNPTEFMSPSYYSPSSTAYTDSPFINPANILTEPPSFSSATSGLPCFRPLPETNPIFRELMANRQFMKAMNLQPIANNIFPWNNANIKPNPFMLQTPNYLPYEAIPINIENLKKNKLFSTAIESNLQKLKDAPAEIWTAYDETNSYAYTNDSGTKIHENIVPESHLQTVPYTLDSKEYPKLVVKEDVTSSPIETLSFGTELSKPKPVTQSLPIKINSSKKNELSAPILELNSQKLETASSEIWTSYDEKSNYNTNDSGTKIHEDIVPERHLETVPYSLETEENLEVYKTPISNYATESKLNHGRPVSYSQVKEPEYYQPILEVPQASNMEWLPLSNTDYSPISPPGSPRPCSKSPPFIPSFNQSPYLQALPHFPSFLQTTLQGSPYKNKLDSLPYSSSPYYPATVEEYSEIPTTAPFRNYTPLLPFNSNVLENLVPFEGTPYLPSAVSSPYTRLPSPASYLPSYQSNMTPLPGLQLSPPTAEQLRFVSPITESPSPIEYTPVQSPINALPLKSMTPIPCPSTTSALPIQNVLPSQEAAVSYESYEQPGPSSAPKYQNIIEHLPTPVPLKESPVFFEPASSPRLVKSPNIIESLPFTMSPSSEDIRRPASDNLSPINYASYTSPIEEYLEASPSLPCRPLIKPSSPQPKPHLPVDEYTILPSSSDTQPLETYSSYQTEPYSQDILKPHPKSRPDLAKYLPVDVSPCQIIEQLYAPVNKVQTPSNFEYISESSPLLKQLLAPPFTGYNSLPFATNVKLPYLSPTYMPLDMINTLPPALINPFIKSEVNDIRSPLSVPTNIITSTPKESNTVSDISSLDNYEEYIEPCPLPKPLQSSSLIKPLMIPIKALPELMKEEIPIEFENVFASSADIPQYISPTNSLLKQLIGNAYNSPFFVPQNNEHKPSEIDNAKLSTHEPIICNIDETLSPNAPILSELPDIKPCAIKAPLFDQYQSHSTEKISPITMTPLSTTKSPLFTSSYQEICPVELAETLHPSTVKPSSIFTPPHRPSKINPISMQYGPKSIVEYMPDINNICPSEIPSYTEPALVDSTQYAPKTKNVKQIQLDGFPISELFAKAPKILPNNPLSKIEIPKISEYQNLPKDSSDWVLLNNDNMADETNAKLTPCEYTETTENPAEAEYLKLAKLLESKTPKTEFEKYSELIEENQYEELPTNLLDFNVCKNIYKPENIGINLHLPQKPQNSATFDNFYANNHIGASPLICLIDPRRESKPIKSLIDAKLPYNEINPDITYLDENPSGNIELATDSDYNFITPSENLRSIPVSLTEVNPISLDTKYLDKPTFKSPQMKYHPNPVEYLPENQYYYPPKDNIDDIKYSGYKTYQLPTQKLAEKSSNIPLETYYPAVPLSTPKPSIPYSYIPTISPETYIPEYETLESHIQPKSDLKVQPQSPIYNNYYPTNEVTVKKDNFDGNNEIKNCIINYINSKGLKDKLYTNNEEITIPIGDIAITKKEPHTAKVLPTSNPSIGLKVWQSNVKLVKAELKFKTNEVSVYNFMPILNNLNEYDIQEIRKIIKKYIDDKYGNHIEVNEPYTIDNQYTVIKDLNRNENDKYNLLWPTYYV
ncbi:uncharacterized protein LOC135119242 [Helicoverpa armigera]|uniref:uncharacterized protein LOC135119242 n=1 Tax=Helicoverpa armigera TaxID=29058 RepID=UPI00308320FD